MSRGSPGQAQGQARLVEADHADVVAQYLVAGAAEMGGQGRFARSRRAGEGIGAAAGDDRIGVERQQAALMAEDAECRAEQEQPEIALGPVAGGIDDDLAAAADQIARDAVDGQHDRVAGDLEPPTRGLPVRKRLGQAAEPDVDDRPRAGLLGRNQLGERDFRAQAEVEAGIEGCRRHAGACRRRGHAVKRRADAQWLSTTSATRRRPRGAVELDEDVDGRGDIVAHVVAVELGAGLEDEQDDLLDRALGAVGMDGGHRARDGRC